MGKRLPYLLLDDLCVRVEKDGTLFAEAASAPAYSLTKRLGPVLSERVAFFNHDPSADALSRVQGQVQELKSVMVDNIDRILDRGDRLELLVHRTDDLQVGSIAFKRDAHRAKRAFQWQHLRLKLAVGGGVLLLAYVVVCVVCSPTFQC
ncbi:hypothetical protein H632_c3665p0 [Helicosporidium sp. ATCC 50920]|nr:hypothetical protein H632_c3665p0 [Helicosporidium sp. ATCC 50920]|eukprot:KDD72228.1 hypothetical protein H632_c3665p0 [Helicosporidium sp. ATCC 50920]